MPFLTVPELAERWRCSPQDVLHALRCGGVPTVVLGPRLLRVRLEDVEAFEAKTPAPAAAPAAKALMTVAQVAERWNCSPRHVRQMVYDGTLPRVPLGPRICRIRPSDVEAIEARSEAAPTPLPAPPPAVPPLRNGATAARPRLAR
jgi:excisionase family DNA binding protein